jgi:hypothetical protein
LPRPPSSLFYIFTKKETDQALFSAEQLDFLGAALSRAFTEVTPDEWVVFGLTERTAPVSKMTTGGFYVDSDAMHVVLANYQFAVTLPGVLESLINDPMRPNMGRLFQLVAGAHQTLVPHSRVRNSLFDPAPAELSMNFKPVFAAAHGSPASTGLEHQPGSKSFPGPEPATAEQRLDQLKRLREQGLIMEEEYREKKRQVLEAL